MNELLLSSMFLTFRNLLSSAYRRLGVQTRNAAVMQVKEMGLILEKANNKQYKRKKSGLDHIWQKLEDV